MLPGCRSSDFFWRVHLLVADSTASSMSLAMLRGRAGFSFLVIGLLGIVGENDRTLAAVCVLDVRRCQVQRADDRRAGVGPHLGQRAFEALARCAEGAEWIADRGAPVRAGDELAGHAAPRHKRRLSRGAPAGVLLQ